ncbi:MAG TPA: hypothetical protein VGO66_00565 [Solirubrobacterales bacterium]|jgi:hypothetical protein|nr:hypothetical protein [Solirubrobacterales bacterium]
MRVQGAESYESAVKQLTAIGPNPSFTWEQILEIESQLARAHEAVRMVRSTTANPEHELEPEVTR